LSTPTSLNQLSQLKNLTSIFPNPSSTHVTIENKTSPFTKVEIFDASGKLVHQSSFMPTNKNDFYLALNKGIYFVNVFNQQELVSKQELIIQ
jgi:hypothetical protein